MGDLTFNTLHLRLTDTTGIVQLPYEIPAQTLTLKSYRVQFNSDASALANPVVYIQFPFLGSGQLNDNNSTFSRLPVLIGPTSHTLGHPEIKNSLDKPISSHFEYSIHDSAGAIFSDAVLEELDLTFEFVRGII